MRISSIVALLFLGGCANTVTRECVPVSYVVEDTYLENPCETFYDVLHEFDALHPYCEETPDCEWNGVLGQNFVRECARLVSLAPCGEREATRLQCECLVTTH